MTYKNRHKIGSSRITELLIEALKLAITIEHENKLFFLKRFHSSQLIIGGGYSVLKSFYRKWWVFHLS